MISPEASQIHVQVIAFLMPPHTVVPLDTSTQGVFLCVLIFPFYKYTNQIGLGHILITHFNLVLYRCYLQNLFYSEVRVGAQTY